MHGKGKLSSVPHCWQLAMDKIALYYSQILQRMYIAYRGEKRTIARSPNTDFDGNIYMFQLLCKGTTNLCLGNYWTRHFAKFRSGFISHWKLCGNFCINLKREISHGEMFPPQTPPLTAFFLGGGKKIRAKFSSVPQKLEISSVLPHLFEFGRCKEDTLQGSR